MKYQFLILLLGTAHLSTAFANIADTYGFGARSAALGGASVAWSPDAFAAYLNPAQLGAMGDQRLYLDYGIVYAAPSFKPINNVVLENNWASDKSPARSGNVDMDYKSTFGQVIGIAYQIAPSLGHWGLGLNFYFPFAQSAYFDSGEVYIPEYVLYRSRNQQPQIEFGTGIQIAPWLYLGAGVHTGFALSSTTKAFLQTDSTRPSYIRNNATSKPKFAPYLGLLVAPDATGKTPGDWSLGLAFRFALNSTYDGRVESGTGVFTSYPAINVNFDATSSLLYEPLSVELGTQFAYSSMSRVYFQLDYQAWGKFEPPAIALSNPSGIAVSTGHNPTFKAHDIFIPRIGHEVDFTSWRLRLGYAYKPSIFTEVPNGAGNYLDPPQHRFQVGAGIPYRKFLGFETPTELSMYLALHQLVTQTITKSAGNEGGDANDSKIGAPGYEAGGRILGGGASLSFGF